MQLKDHAQNIRLSKKKEIAVRQMCELSRFIFYFGVNGHEKPALLVGRVLLTYLFDHLCGIFVTFHADLLYLLIDEHHDLV